LAKRFISLYYGSIGKRRALQALGAWVASCFIPAASSREALANAVRAQLGDGAVFALGSGRAALAACMKSAGLGAGDEVLLSSYTCLAVPTAVIAAGAKPVYADIDADTLNVDANVLSTAFSPRVRAIIVQHTLGKMAPVQAILGEARKRGVLVIEDCALAAGSSVAGQSAGTFGDAAVFSMELSKTLSCGWGGILLVRDRKLADEVERFYAALPEPGALSAARDLWQTAISAWCYQPSLYEWAGKYVLYFGFKCGLFRRSTPEPEFEGHVGPGFMKKMGGPQARLAMLQWRDFGMVAKACADHGRRLRELLKELRFPLPGAPGPGEISVAPRVSFLVRDRQAAQAYFMHRGIELGEWFDGPVSPVPQSPLFNYEPGRYPNAERIARSVVNLPCHSRITEADLSRMANLLREFVELRAA
jgi:dTDP-4-amino-4,6-dideoxygalactose transaminase